MLDRYAVEMETLADPERVARQALGVNDYGWTREAYNPEAFRIWGELHAERPDDALVAHHLAIMHNARAIDLENGERPEESDEDWRSAMDLWGRVWRDDGFWEALGKRISDDNRKDDIVRRVRETWPGQLLRFHLAIAFDPEETGKERRQFHLAMAKEAPFPAHYSSTARSRVYEDSTAGIDDQVWRSDILDPEIVTPGIQVIAAYLEVDPTHIDALSDLLRLQCRLSLAGVQDINAKAGDTGARAGRARTLCREGVKWDEYIRHLMSCLEDLQDDIREKLYFWYRTLGDASLLAENYDDAQQLYGIALQATQEPRSRRYALDSIGVAKAMDLGDRAGRAMFGKEKQDLIAEVDVAVEDETLSVDAICILVVCYDVLGAVEKALQTAERGIAMEPDIEDLSSFERFQRGKQKLADLVKKLRNKVGTVKFKPGRQPSPGTKLGSEKSMDETRDIVRKMDDVKKFDEEFGGEDAYDLRQEAARAFQSGDLETAERSLREAIEKSSNPQKMQGELSELLATIAEKMMDEAGADLSSATALPIDQKLEEAIRLDPDNQAAKTIREKLRSMVRS